MEAPAAIPASSGLRPAPRVIQMLPPPGRALSRGGVLLLIGLALIAVTLGVLDWSGSRLTAVLLFVAATVLAAIPFRIEVSYRKWQRRSLERCDPIGQDAESMLLSRLWQTPSPRPGTEDIRQTVNLHFDQASPHARIVCLGGQRVPIIGDLRFEPQIIPATMLLTKRLLFVPIALAVLVLWMLQIRRVIPVTTNLAWFDSLFFLGVSAGVAWFWRAGIRPSYIRLAPGIVQFIQFPWRRGTPSIRSYPIDQGTLVVVSQFFGQLGVTFMRGGRQDHLPLWQMRGPEKQLERVWSALLSTAPTPPLSDEELLG